MSTATMARSKTAGKARAGRPAPGADQARLARACAMFDLMRDATRLRVVLMLEAGELNVTEMCARLGQSQPAVSHHLALCRHADVLSARREGKNNFYSLTDRGREAARAARAAMG